MNLLIKTLKISIWTQSFGIGLPGRFNNKVFVQSPLPYRFSYHGYNQKNTVRGKPLQERRLPSQ